MPSTMPGIGFGLDDRVAARVAAERVDELREPEVDDLGVAVVGEHHVGRLQVAVDDALLVRAREPFGDLDGEVERARRRQRAARRQVARACSPRTSSIAMKLTPSTSSISWMTAMCGMLEGRRRLRLLHEARAAVRIGDEIGRQDFQRDLAIQPRRRGRDRPRPCRRG